MWELPVSDSLQCLSITLEPLFAPGEGLTHYSVYSEVQELVEALATYGHDIESHDHFAASKPLLSARPYAVFALRRTPPTIYTPKAKHEPVLRIPYVWFNDRSTNEQLAVLMLIADKSECSNEKPVVHRPRRGNRRAN